MVFGDMPRVRARSNPVQVHFFQESDPARLEARINAWLAERGRTEIVEVHQSALEVDGEHQLIVSIWYLED